jgi:hypothetical protein
MQQAPAPCVPSALAIPPPAPTQHLPPHRWHCGAACCCIAGQDLRLHQSLSHPSPVTWTNRGSRRRGVSNTSCMVLSEDCARYLDELVESKNSSIDSSYTPSVDRILCMNRNLRFEILTKFKRCQNKCCGHLKHDSVYWEKNNWARTRSLKSEHAKLTADSALREPSDGCVCPPSSSTCTACHSACL